jgi:hypothetical protein
MKTRTLHATLAMLGLLMVLTARAGAEKSELKSIGFDMHFTEHPLENPDVVEIFEGDTVKVVLHQSSVFGKEGLKLPDKEDIQSEESYFIYPGNGCAQDCLSSERLTPSEIYPFAQNYYVLAPNIIGQNTKVVLMDRAVVVGEDVTEKTGGSSKGSKPVVAGVPTGPSTTKPPLPAPPVDDGDWGDDEDWGDDGDWGDDDDVPPPPHPGVDEDCGDEGHPCVDAEPLDTMYWPDGGDLFAPVTWSVPSSPMQSYPSPAKYLQNSFLLRYYETCADQSHNLDYKYWYVDEEGGIVEESDTVVIPAFYSDMPVEKWFEMAVQENGNERIEVQYVDGRIILLGRKVGENSVYNDNEGMLPPGTVVHIRVETKINPCEGAFLGFLPTGTYRFPYTSRMPNHVYDHKKYVQMQSNVCEVDEALTAVLRPRLPSDAHHVYKCPFNKKAVLSGPFWAFFTTQQVYKQKGKSKKVEIVVNGDPVPVMSNGQQIVNVEARISYDGAAATAESFYSPTLDTPIYYYIIKNAKPGVYAITPVINVEDPSTGSGESQQMPGRVILVKVQTRDKYSMIRLQMGIISYSEFRAMAFTVMITPILNPKSFFKRKFLPAPYPMPHIGLRLGSQDDIVGLQVGFGIALLKEFIIVGGLQFGTQDLTTPWDWRKAWYIGVAIDPWLLQKTISASTE